MAEVVDISEKRWMKVFMLTDYFPPHIGGGVERVTLELSQRLVRRGHEVAVLTLNTTKAPDNEIFEGIRVYRVPAMDLSSVVKIQMAFSVKILPHALRLARAFAPDVLHTHNLFFRSTEVALILKKILKVPLVTTLHLGRVSYLKGWGRLLAEMYEQSIGRLVMKNSDHVIAVSKAVADRALRLGARWEKLSIVVNGVDVVRFSPAPPSLRNPGKKIVFVGRLLYNKGPQFLLRAAPLILSHHPDARIIFVGDGPLRGELEKEARRLNLDEQIIFMGMRYDVEQILRDATIFVRPSLLEGLPIAVLEAMACGLPIVATSVGGTPEAVEEGRTGFLISPGDVRGLAERVSLLLDRPGLREQMGKAARLKVEQYYDWEKVTEQTEAVYNSVLK